MSCVVGVGLVGLVALPSIATGSASARSAVGTATATPIDPDTFQCDQPGFVGFEDLAGSSPLTARSVAGLRFSTPGGDTWRVGDFGTGTGGWKFPAGLYTSEETHWATVAAHTTSARIDFPRGPASHFVVLVTDYSPISLGAYAVDGSLLIATQPTKVPNGRHMILMGISEPTKSIDHVVLDGGGSKFQVDSICTDAAGVPHPQLFLTAAEGAPKSSTTVKGSGFGKNETIDISIDNCPSGSAQTGPGGAFKRSIPICSTAPAGPATIIATGRSSHRTGTANFVVRTNWVQNGFDPGRSAYNPFENQINVTNAPGLHLAWPAPVLMGGRPTESVIAEGVVYAGSADGAVYAINDATGKVLWSCVPGQRCTVAGPAPGRPAKFIALRGSPAVDGNRLFVAGADGNVWALDTGTGNPIWHYAIGTRLNHEPLIKNGIVYIGADNGNVYALTESGTPAWPAPVALGSAVHSTLAADGAHVYVGTDSGNLYALDLLTGDLAWTGTTGLRIRSSPAVANGVVFVGSADGNVYAWNASTGNEIWHHDTGAPVGAAIAVAKGLVYVGTELGDLDELSISDGHVVHSAPTGGSITSRAAEANGVVYVGSGSQKVFAFSQDTLTQLFSYPLSTNVTEVAVTNGAIYVGSDDHMLYKFVP